ncbi:MAG: ribose 5-phosphate isomerase B [Candidatus Omnitrophica bacterium]|nr:ribose 5-phosphate isomerase B [Candidatus Omnitrophota bacterium]
MKIALASDHRGFKLKKILIDYLKDKCMETVDFGTYSLEPCDYPDLVYPAVKAVEERRVERAIVICYTGIGSSIVANRIKGIRAALVLNTKMAVLSRKHNDSNVLVLGAGFIKQEEAKKIVSKWLNTDFEGGRHLRRLKKIKEIEEKENV